MNERDLYFAKMSPFATIASVQTGMPVSVILAQWAHESAYGKSSLAQRANNHAGIKYTNHADFKSGAYSGYNSLFSFANDYARVMQLGYYDSIRNAEGVEDTVRAFVGSPYAEDTSYAEKLGNVITGNPATYIAPLAIIGGVGLLILSFMD